MEILSDIYNTLRSIDSMVITDWIRTIFIVIGGTIALKTYANSRKQNRLDNSFKLLDFTASMISDRDMKNWSSFWNRTSEIHGAKHGHFLDNSQNHIPLIELYSGGTSSIDNNTMLRLTEIFNIVAKEITEKTVDANVIYYKYGQIIDHIYLTLSSIEEVCDDGAGIREIYPYIFWIYEKEMVFTGSMSFRYKSVC